MSAAKASEKPVTAQSPNNLAVVSLVAGILGLTLVPFVGSIVAIVSGVAARNEIRSDESAGQGEGMAIAGLVLGILGVVLPLAAFCLVGTLVLFPACLAGFLAITGVETGSLMLPFMVVLV